MEKLNQEIIQLYGHRRRLRVCGILIENNTVLLISHRGIGKGGYLWTPPGGGMEEGETATQTLEREFLEETGLHIKATKFLYVHEYVCPPLHALELLFLVEKIAGNLQLGCDPEMTNGTQILSELAFVTEQTIFGMEPKYCHHIFGLVNNFMDLKNISGYYLSG